VPPTPLNLGMQNDCDNVPGFRLLLATGRDNTLCSNYFFTHLRSPGGEHRREFYFY
jgi:hypothetical protein